MEFKIMLIVFAILLFLLTVLSAFGGSMKVGEPFTVGSNVKRTYTNSMEPSNMSMPPSEMPSFNGQVGIQAGMPAGTPSGTPPLVFPPILESYAPPMQKSGSRSQGGTVKPVMAGQMPKGQLPGQKQGFTNIEPYEMDDGPKYASY